MAANGVLSEGALLARSGKRATILAAIDALGIEAKLRLITSGAS